MNSIKEKINLVTHDVKNKMPMPLRKKFDLGKEIFSIPYLLTNGFEIVTDEYQIMLKKIH